MAFKLPLFDRNIKLVKEDGRPEATFHQWWQAVVRAIEDALTGLQESIVAIEVALEAADIALQAADTAQQAAQQAQDVADTAQQAAQTAQDAADNAQDAADTAQGGSDTANRVTNLVNSGPVGVAIHGFDAGTDATIIISSHFREYGDGTTVSVNSGNVFSLAYNTGYYIYYNDPSRTGGAVTYQVSTTSDGASQIGDRHLVGYIITPDFAAPDTLGATQRPPGVNIGEFSDI